MSEKENINFKCMHYLTYAKLMNIILILINVPALINKIPTPLKVRILPGPLSTGANCYTYHIIWL